MAKQLFPDLSVVIPSFNHAQVLQNNLPVLLRYLQERRISSEVIVADDGSTDQDRTRAVAAMFGCAYVRNPRNLGKGAAVRLGMQRAKGKARLFTDADIPFEPESIERFLWHLTFNKFDLVVGNRNLPESSYLVEVPWSRRLGSRIYAGIVSRLAGNGWDDTQCGLKAFRGEVAEDLFSVGRINRFGFDVELLHVASQRNYRIKRLPVNLRSRGPSSVRLYRDGARMFWDLGAIYRDHLLGRYERRPFLLNSPKHTNDNPTAKIRLVISEISRNGVRLNSNNT